MVTLLSDYANFNSVTVKLLDVQRRASSLDVEFQKLIAENLMLRLFYELEGTVETVAMKLACGAPFMNGTAPLLLLPPFRGQEKVRQFIIAGKKSKSYLKWTTFSDLKSNLGLILDQKDDFLSVRKLFDSTYEDMRHVRNHIAHNTESTRKKFVPVAGKVYVKTQGISTAKFLLCQRAAIPSYGGTESAIVQYIKWSRTFLKALLKAP